MCGYYKRQHSAISHRLSAKMLMSLNIGISLYSILSSGVGDDRHSDRWKYRCRCLCLRWRLSTAPQCKQDTRQGVMQCLPWFALGCLCLRDTFLCIRIMMGVKRKRVFFCLYMFKYVHKYKWWWTDPTLHTPHIILLSFVFNIKLLILLYYDPAKIVKNF